MNAIIDIGPIMRWDNYKNVRSSQTGQSGMCVISGPIRTIGTKYSLRNAEVLAEGPL